MPGKRQNSNLQDRHEALLGAIATEEQYLRERGRLARLHQDEARRRGEHANRTFWAGYSDACYEAAGRVAQLYETGCMVLVDRPVGTLPNRS